MIFMNKCQREIEYLRRWLRWLRDHPSPMSHKIRMALGYVPWRGSYWTNRNPVADEIPWINFEARYFIEQILTLQSVVFEYSTGGSTLFFAKGAKHVYAVEHELEWFDRVKTALTMRGYANCNIILVPPEHADSTGNPEDWEECTSRDGSYHGCSFHKYVSSIDLYPDRFFDLVVVDGRARPSCVFHSYRKVKIGGHLMLDDSDRSHYQKARSLLAGWQQHEFYGPKPYQLDFSQTTIWKRPRN
jgi:hypothetical protein